MTFDFNEIQFETGQLETRRGTNYKEKKNKLQLY